MSHKWWHFLGGSPEEKRLEELRAEEARILKSNEKYGEGAIELNKENLKNIQNEINQIKMDNPDNEDIQSGYVPDQPTGGGITDIVVKAGKNIAANKALDAISSVDPHGLATSQIEPMDLEYAMDLAQKGDFEGLGSLFYDEVAQGSDVASDVALNYVLNEVGLGDPTTPYRVGANLIKTGTGEIANLSNVISEINLGDNLLADTAEKGLDIIDKPIQWTDEKVKFLVDLMNKKHKDASDAIWSSKLGTNIKNVAGLPFDFLADNVFYNLAMPTFPWSKTKIGEPDDSAQLTNDQINQIVEDEINLSGGSTPPPIVVTNTQKPWESGVGQGTGQTGGAAGMGFAPPPPPTSGNVGTSGMTWRDVINRADGGIIQKYNHGGLHKNPHTDDIDLSGILNPSIPDEIKDELMKYLLNKYMQEQELMKERRKDQYNQPPPTMLEAADGGLATIPRYLKGR